MATIVSQLPVGPGAERVPRYAGLRMSADEYLALPDDGFRYEVIDGVVIMAPRPKPRHQLVLRRLSRQLERFLDHHPIGEFLPQVDVCLGDDLVCTPDLAFFRSERFPTVPERIDTVPDLVVEILSPSTEARDLNTKMIDYERFGVAEYWVIDPIRKAVRVFVRGNAGAFEEQTIENERFLSRAVPGFVLDVADLKAVMG